VRLLVRAVKNRLITPDGLTGQLPNGRARPGRGPRPGWPRRGRWHDAALPAGV